jgi:membrane protease YdiL (CAAX protease family)
MDNEQPSRGEVVRLAILFEGGLGVLACAAGWLVGVLPWEKLHWDWAGLGLGLAAGVPMLGLLLLFALCPWAPFRRIGDFVEKVVRPLFRECTVGDLALISVLAGLGEELFFRGLIQEGLSGWLGAWPAVAVSAVLFGLLHPMTPMYAVLAAGAGAYFGATFLLSGNLLVAATAHAFYDFAALIYLLRIMGARVPSAQEPVTGGEDRGSSTEY